MYAIDPLVGKQFATAISFFFILKWSLKREFLKMTKICLFIYLFIYFLFTLGIPLGETLFFRGAQQLQTHQNIKIVLL